MSKMNIPKMNIVTPQLSSKSVIAAWISLVSAALFLVLLVILHIIEPEFDPSWRFISEYELGQFGWLMVVAFLLLGVSSASLILAIYSQIRTIGGYLGMAFLLISCIGFILAAIFQTDPITATQISDHGNVHNMAAILGGFIPLAAILIGWSLARNIGWASVRRSLVWITGIALVGLVATFYMSSLVAQSQNHLGPGVLVGWPNRLMIIAFAGWILALAWCTVRLYKKSINAPGQKS